ncbi:hypothetical protein FJW05_10720 [Mesorhizobium sp. B2-9-1]|uniref:hypothetical protein n=1 Tax=unclassified Mesorhizobium TaxID=325217 RepID=UPI001129AABE|nr:MULTISPECIES: hypothetical protein [unclassified Mesorhizobium]TPI47446.1 hypothetical protein FJW05_10720 [Mesorhizobium sp. B2-9-1]TPO08036.1 hypothetical protein FJ980_11675 [Mesorhizobium sp. B1-1-5]
MAKKKHRRSACTVSAASDAEILEAAYFARKCGLTREEALQMIREAHNLPAVRAAEGEKRKH